MQAILEARAAGNPTTAGNPTNTPPPPCRSSRSQHPSRSMHYHVYLLPRSLHPLHHSSASSRIARNAHRQMRLKGVAETQSPPGSTHQAKSAAVAQGGIYAAGQLVDRNSSKMPFFKDKSAPVLVASMNQDQLTLFSIQTCDGRHHVL
jgi:hypothetical protein